MQRGVVGEVPFCRRILFTPALQQRAGIRAQQRVLGVAGGCVRCCRGGSETRPYVCGEICLRQQRGVQQRLRGGQQRHAAGVHAPHCRQRVRGKGAAGGKDPQRPEARLIVVCQRAVAQVQRQFQIGVFVGLAQLQVCQRVGRLQRQQVLRGVRQPILVQPARRDFQRQRVPVQQRGNLRAFGGQGLGGAFEHLADQPQTLVGTQPVHRRALLVQQRLIACGHQQAAVYRAKAERRDNALLPDIIEHNQRA